MTLIQSIIFIFTSLSFAEPVTYIDQRHISPICSTAKSQPDAERVSLPNAHIVVAKNFRGMPIYRSNSPYKTQHVLDIKNLEIGKVIVYKTFYDEADKELLYSLYRDSGYDTNQLEHVPMPWKREGKKAFDFQGTCEMTVEAMNDLMYSKVPSLFHCTVGEDRTGLLAGLLQVRNGMSLENAFRDEMCARGFEAGNPRKSESPSVVSAVREVLTPLFLKMATVIINNGSISKKDCAYLPDVYVHNIRPEELICDSVSKEALCPVAEHLSEETTHGIAPKEDVLPVDY